METVSNYYIREHLDGTFSVDIEWETKRPWKSAKYRLETMFKDLPSMAKAQEYIDQHVIMMNGPKTVKSSWHRGPDGTVHYCL